MKVDWNKRYTTISVYSLLVIVLSIIFYQITSEMNIFKTKISGYLKILTPFVIGFVMAYLFNFILVLYEKRIFKKMRIKNILGEKSKKSRIVGMILTYITVAIIVYVLSNFVFPQIISSLKGIINNIPGYIEDTSEWLIQINDRLALNEEYSKLVLEKWDEFINQAIEFATNLIPMFGNMIKGVLSSIWNIILGIIVSIYILMDKEKFIALSKKMTMGIFSKENSNKIIEITNRANYIFSKFIAGKILDSAIVGLLTFVILTIFKIPFTILVSFIISVTNIIPFFGPFIGAIPSVVIILFESPIKALWFILIIIVIQQIDGNIIGPKILGDSLGISPFWILFSLMITGKIFGFIGLIIGVPLFTLFYSIIKDIVESRLIKKGLPKNTKDYMNK